MSGAYPIIGDNTIAFTIVGAGGKRSWIEIGLDGRPTPEAAAMILTAIAAGVDGRISLKPIPVSLQGVVNSSYVITDSQGRKSWVDIGLDGRPTPEAAAMIDVAIAALTNLRIDAKTAALPLPQTINDGPGLSYVIVDSGGRKSEIQLDSAGRFTGPFPERIIQAASDAAILAANPAAGFPAVLWGDSMTAAGSGYGDKLAAELGKTVSIQGIGGQGTQSIAARQGGYPATVTFPSDTMPAGTAPTTVTVSAVPYSSPSGTGTTSGTVTIAGVTGTLTRDNVTQVHTFTRAVAGAAAWVPPTTPIITQEAATYQGNVAVIWSGRNSFLTMTKEDIVLYIQKMIDFMTAGKKRFLVLEIAPSDSETPGTANRTALDALNTLLQKTWPHNFVPVARYLRGPALADMGITPTTQDTTDIGNGITPVSLRGDALHLNPNGNIAVARLVSNTMKAKGWA
jgi:hypothetical protein